jgi:beta-barrel assembly-enhancing protease
MKYALLIFCALFNNIIGSAQYDDFKGLRSKGLLTAEYLSSSSEKFYSDIANDARLDTMTTKEREAMISFYLRTHFFMDYNLTNGTVLVNSEVGNYVEKVLDKLLADKPEVREKMKVLMVRNPYVNAYATEQGIILVNLGLMSKVRNEAELAFILAHESIHFINNHNSNLALEEVKIQNQVEYMGNSGVSEKIFRKHAYNRNLESEADIEGIDLFLNAGYNEKYAYSVFDVLDSASFPYSFQEVDLEPFRPQGFAFPDSIKLIQPSKVVLVVDDELTTHPGTDERRRGLKKRLGGSIKDEGLNYLVSEEEFMRVRDLSRLDMAHYYNAEELYVSGFYHSLTMLKEFPGNPYLERSLMESLYKLSMAHVNGRFMTKFSLNDQGIEDDLAELFDDLRSEEILVIAIHHAFDLLRANPDERYYLDVFNSLMSEIIKETGYKVREVGVAYNSSRIFNGMEYLELSASDTTWKELWEKANDELASRKKSERGSPSTYVSIKETEKALRKGARLNADSILVYSPFYFQADSRKPEYIDFLGGEERESFFIKTLEEQLQDFGKAYSVLDVSKFSEADVDKLNDMMLIQDWMNDVDVHEDYSDASIYSAGIDSLRGKYKCDYLLVAGMYTERSISKNLFRTAWIALPLMNVVAVPFYLVRSFMPRYESYFVYTLYDFEEKRVVYSEGREIRGLKNKDQIIRHHLYDFTQSISHE